jgi:hypothetical protein
VFNLERIDYEGHKMVSPHGLLHCRLMIKAMWWTSCRIRMVARWGCGGAGVGGWGEGVVR